MQPHTRRNFISLAGKGLGLALTKEILEASGGKISLSSEAGFGSEVTILLPFTKRP